VKLNQRDADATEVTPFSILERIDVGETNFGPTTGPRSRQLSVSSNGSTWVKQHCVAPFPGMAILSVSSNGSTWVKRHELHAALDAGRRFQYPRTDRRG